MLPKITFEKKRKTTIELQSTKEKKNYSNQVHCYAERHSLLWNYPTDPGRVVGGWCAVREATQFRWCAVREGLKELKVKDNKRIF